MNLGRLTDRTEGDRQVIVGYTRIYATALVAMLLLLLNCEYARAVAPIKLVLSSHVGREVDKTTKSYVCTIVSKDECGEAVPSSSPGGFELPEDVVGGSTDGDVYVADAGNFRVQELTDTGEFVTMFGRKVNDNGGSVCTKAEESECKAGESSAFANAFVEPQSIAVDPGSGNVYVLDHANWRVDEYTPEGQFVLMVGKEVNAQGGNICTSAEEDDCKAGVRSGSESIEKAAFNFASDYGDLLAIGTGSQHLLYVGDEHRVQEFDEQGEWKGEIKLPRSVIDTAPGGYITALAVDDETGLVYIDYANQPTIHVYDPVSGSELEQVVDVSPREAAQPVEVRAIAIDPSGHLAVWAYEGEGETTRQYGSLYEAEDGHLLTQFTTPEYLRTAASRQFHGISGIGFNSRGEFYVSFSKLSEIWNYTPEPVAELTTGSFVCAAGAAHDSSSTFSCTVGGEVNPEEIANTNTWFEWGAERIGSCSVSSDTASHGLAPVDEDLQVSTAIEGLRPNAGFCYDVSGTDQNAEPPEKLTGLTLFGRTPVAAPKVIGRPQASFVGSSSAVLYGEVNPENANTEYFVEYAPATRTLEEMCPRGVLEETCQGVSRTGSLNSEIYGQVGATLEARNLRPDTEYRYRLTAHNSAALALGMEGVPFETEPAPRVEAETGAATSVTETSATIAGAVDPDGAQATYAFELGRYEGAGSQYDTVYSGSTGAGAGAEQKSYEIAGLQPGTTYAYRISIYSGFGEAQGAAATFTTAPQPELLPRSVSPVQLGIPKIAFPKAGVAACKRGYARDKRGLCVKVKTKSKRRNVKHTAKRKKSVH